MLETPCLYWLSAKTFQEARNSLREKNYPKFREAFTNAVPVPGQVENWSLLLADLVMTLELNRAKGSKADFYELDQSLSGLGLCGIIQFLTRDQSVTFREALHHSPLAQDAERLSKSEWMILYQGEVEKIRKMLDCLNAALLIPDHLTAVALWMR